MYPSTSMNYKDIILSLSYSRSTSVSTLYDFVPGSARLIFPRIQMNFETYYSSKSNRISFTSAIIDFSNEFRSVESDVNTYL